MTPGTSMALMSMRMTWMGPMTSIGLPMTSIGLMTWMRSAEFASAITTMTVVSTARPARTITRTFRCLGVRVQGVEGEVGAAVAEVVFLAPPGGHPVDDGGGGQVSGGAGGQDADLAGVAGLAAGDLPQGQHAAFMLAFADGQVRRGVGEVVGVLAAVVAGAAGHGERGPGQVGDVLAGVVLAVGQQVEPGVGDVGEQGRGPAARSKHKVGFARGRRCRAARAAGRGSGRPGRRTAGPSRPAAGSRRCR